MASILRCRKLRYVEPVKCSTLGLESLETLKSSDKAEGGASAVVVNTINRSLPGKRRRRPTNDWRYIDWYCWMVGYLCTTWWLLLLLSHFLSGFQAPESPGSKLKREGLKALHPVVLVPGIVIGGLELWEGRPCADGLFRKRLWSSSFTENFRRPLCWLEHLSLDSVTGLDPPGIRVRPVTGLAAADYFAPGYFLWTTLIENLAKVGYEGKNLHMATYDWRLSFQNTEVRDQSLSRLKSKIELMFVINGYRKVVVVPHSMGSLYFLHFLKWVEAPAPMGGGGGPGWCAKHIKAIMNIGPLFLGVPKAVSNILSSEAKDIAFARTMAPVVLDSNFPGLQTLEHIMQVSRTWDSMMSLIPKGGETIWGDLDWSPEEEYNCDSEWKKNLKASSRDQSHKTNISDGQLGFRVKESVKFGRIISFGKMASKLPSSELRTFDFKDLSCGGASTKSNSSCGEVWTEYDELSRESIKEVAENKVYTATTILDLLYFVAPKMMRRANAHFSHGVAENLDDPKYSHYKYWSNPLETKLPDAPAMEIYCLYGVGIPTERSYVYKLLPSDQCRHIPFRIDSSTGGNNGRCLRSGIYFVDGDESVPVLSAGFMCAKGWQGRNRFNPFGISTYIREYRNKPPTILFEGRGLESSSHVDIMGNVALIEDIMRVAAGANGVELGGNRIFSDIIKMSERINLRL
ncbi:PREDICTED: putative phospholipid:diacylglycerol acyltransferase 2 [Nelumbo nucifera]|uniref:Phospholipid:diacylglycerol acyltransferase 2 n=2 Tax=Nelumbo nucifera TaxID=4432 RepID=A0A822Y850_NELNU|nr:PREDICTED: putative phospholipid:diacylglycerol acyltransferase 2 [Nelumbo nucifera]DAD28680.1 TPA_asm: hypothetical protein HUJ06_030148 [Nelumbo nucifera]